MTSWKLRRPLLVLAALLISLPPSHSMSHSHYWAQRIKRAAGLQHPEQADGHTTDQIEYQGSGHALDVPHGVVHLEVDPEAGHGSEGHHDGMQDNKGHNHNQKPERAHDHHYSYCVEREPLHEDHGIHVASWRWDEVRPYYAITMFITIAGLAKLGFHHAHFLSSRVPESCLLILLGVMMGLLTYHFRKTTHEEPFPDIELPDFVGNQSDITPCQTERSAFLPNFDSHLFFLVLLPPIILEASYSLHDRTFADNLGTILLYAVVGTLFNMFTIGPLLYLLAKVGAMGTSMFPAHEDYDIANISMVQMLTFSSLIVAVDPVAVLAIFQEVGVNKDLYFLVFGESLLNDAVTVVLYNSMVAFAGMDGEEPITYDQLLMSVAAFFCVSLGGLAIGVIFGIITAIITKYTTELPVVEPLSLLTLAYLSYLTAELVHFSGIIATVGCGVVQAHYATKNISKNSYITIKYFVSMASGTSDTIIFMFLGMVLVSDDHRWHTGFCLWTLVLCLVFRFIGVYLLTALANRHRMHRIGKKEQFIMAYGGLRGAVGFSLVVMLGDNVIDKETAEVFVTCTLFIVLFTVFVQGSTIKFVVSLFRIRLDEEEEKTLTEEIVGSAFDHIAEGLSEIVGFGGLNRLKERLATWDEKHITPLLVHTEPVSALARLYDKIVLDEHYANLYGPAAVLETQKEYDAASMGSGSLRSYEHILPREPRRKASILPEDLPLETDPTWMRRKSTLVTPGMDIARRLSSAAHLPLPEDELAWLRRISTTTPELPATRPSLGEARRSSLMPTDGGVGRRASLLPLDGGGGRRPSLLHLDGGGGRRPSLLHLDVGRGTALVPPAHSGGRRESLAGGLKSSFARRLSVFGATVQEPKAHDEENGDHQPTRRDSIFPRSPSPHSDKEMLRNAMRENPFNKLHFRYNPNLVDEDNQELESHLRRRRMNARRMSQMAFLPPMAQTMVALTEQAESSVQDSPLSRASMHRKSHNIRRSLRDTPPVRTRSSSLQHDAANTDSPLAAIGKKRTAPVHRTSSPESTSPSPPAPRKVSPAPPHRRVGHVNPTFVITEESDYESEPATTASASDQGSSGPRRASEVSRESSAPSTPARRASEPAQQPLAEVEETPPPAAVVTESETRSAARRPVPTVMVTEEPEEEEEEDEDVTISKL